MKLSIFALIFGVAAALKAPVGTPAKTVSRASLLQRVGGVEGAPFAVISTRAFVGTPSRPRSPSRSRRPSPTPRSRPRSVAPSPSPPTRARARARRSGGRGETSGRRAPAQIQSMLPPSRGRKGQIKTGNAGSIMKH